MAHAEGNTTFVVHYTERDSNVQGLVLVGAGDASEAFNLAFTEIERPSMKEGRITVAVQETDYPAPTSGIMFMKEWEEHE